MSLGKFSKIDYVIVYDSNDVVNNLVRFAFENALTKSGLQISRETIGVDVYLLIHCPFERLAMEAEQVKLEMNLKGCVIEKTSPKFLSGLRSFFETDDELDYVSGSFEMAKLHLFEGFEMRDSFFRSSLRSLLVHHILTNVNYNEDQLFNKRNDGNKHKSFSLSTFSSVNLNVTKKGLPYLLIKNIYKDAFILHDQSAKDPVYTNMKSHYPLQHRALVEKLRLHDDPRTTLHNTWLRMYKFQPLWKIRNYFGEKIAFYFAWEGVYITLLWPPAILGLLSFLYGFYSSFHSATFETCHCECNDHSNNYTLANYTSHYVCTDEIRSNDTIDHLFHTIEQTFNNEMNPYFALFICFWGTLFMEIWKRKNSTLAYEWDVEGFETTELDRPEFFGTKTILDPVTKEFIWEYPFQLRVRRFALSILVVCGMICLVFLTIASIILLQVVMRYKWHCVDAVSSPNCNRICQEHETTGNSTTCFFMTTILPSVVNALLVVFWEFVYSKVATRLTDMENHQTETDYNDALILKLFGFQFVNSYTYLFYIAIFRPETHQLEKNGLFNLGDNFKDVCRPGRCMSYLSVQVFLLMVAKPIVRAISEVVIPWVLSKLKRLVSKFKQKSSRVTRITQQPSEIFGNVYLQRERNKPKVDDFSLEAFSAKVIQFGYVLMFTTAFPLAPFIALLVSLIEIRLDARRLLWFNRRPIAFIAADIGQWQPILLFMNFCGIISNSFLVASSSGITKSMDLSSKLFVMLGFEHLGFLLIYVCEILIPDVPARIKQARRRERTQVTKILSDGYIPLGHFDETVTSPPKLDTLTCVLQETQNGGLEYKQYKELSHCIFASDV